MLVPSRKQSYVVGAAIIAAGGLISKILGAIYRIPLASILGSKGMGIYQMVYPLYCILLTVSASGIPTGLARLVSAKEEGIERVAFRLYGVVGLLGSVFLFLCAKPLSIIMGESAIAPCCRCLAPSVFFVSLLSVVRGYFQGQGNMLPTAASEVSEQLVKVLFGCMLATIFAANLTRAVSSTLLAVTISEFIACLLGVVLYLRQKKVINTPTFGKKQAYKKVLTYTLPLTLMAGAMPIGSLLESIISVKMLRAFSQDATSLFGIYSGCAVTLINLPVSVAYGLAAAVVPQIAPLAQDGNFRAVKRRVRNALFLTLGLSVPFALALYFLSPYMATLVFGNLSLGDRELLISLVKVMAINAVTLSLGQTTSACLTALGYPKRSAASQWIAAMLRVVFSALLLFLMRSIYGVAIASIIGYLVAFLLNICYIIRVGGNHENHTYRFGHKLFRPHSQK